MGKERDMQESICKYLGIKDKPYEKQKLSVQASIHKSLEVIFLNKKKMTSGLRFETYVRKNYPKINQAIEDFKDYGINETIIFEPINYNGYDCVRCSKNKECWIISSLTEVVKIKKALNKLDSPIEFDGIIHNKKGLRQLIERSWLLCRIKQNNCVRKKISYRDLMRRVRMEEED